MQHGSMEKATYRYQDWGPAYLVQGSSSDIGVLRLRPGDEMTNHIHHHCDESFIVTQGSGTLWVSCSKQHTLTVGDVYRCSPGEMHYFVNNTNTPFTCVFVKSPASPGDTVSLPWRPGEKAPTVPSAPGSNYPLEEGHIVADLEGNLSAKNYDCGTPQRSEGFFVKGASGLDFGMRHRLARIFDPADGRTVMLAFDHGYFQGPTRGLERIDLSIVPLAPYADALMATRGIFRSVIPPASDNALVLRASGGASILKELSNERIAMDMADAARIDAAAVAVQVYIGAEYETQSVHNMTRLVDDGLRYGIPVIGVTAVGREMARDARYLRLATRIIAELGAQVVKTYYCEEDFETVTASCPVPIIMAGGTKIPVLDALTMAYRAIEQGAAGVDMGRNIFQRQAPAAMMQAVRGVVHGGLKPHAAADLYADLSHGAQD